MVSRPEGVVLSVDWEEPGLKRCRLLDEDGHNTREIRPTELAEVCSLGGHVGAYGAYFAPRGGGNTIRSQGGWPGLPILTRRASSG